MNCIVGYRRPTWAPFAALVPNPWFTIYICAQMYKEGHNAWAKLKPISQCKRTLKRKEKGTSLPGSSRNTALPSEVTHNLEIYPGACYVFLTVGTYKASQNPTGKTIMVGKSQPQHPEIIDVKIELEETIVQMLTWCLKKVCSRSLGKLSIRDQAGW